MISIIDDISLAKLGGEHMHWFREKMPIISKMNEMLKEEKIFHNKTVAICMHIEPKTAYWIEGILASGAKHVYLVGCLGTTKPDTAAYLASLNNITVLGKTHDTYEDHKSYLTMVMTHKIDLFLDNGASLILAHREANVNWHPIGANEETRSGKLLIEASGYRPAYPIFVIDDSPLKQFLENAIGVGQSVVDGFMRATSLLVGGKKVLIIGYGYCGSGVAAKFKGLGATTLVYDNNPLYLLKAKVEGHYTGELEMLIPLADVIMTVTGRFNILASDHIHLFKDGVILANAGHYRFEIDVEGIKTNALSVDTVKTGIEVLKFHDKKVFILENAHPLNLSAADGNPIEIMDLGLGLQSASAHRIIANAKSLPVGMQPVPDDIVSEISKLTLEVLE